MVKRSPANAGGAGLIPGGGVKIPTGILPHPTKETEQKQQKQNCSKFSKDFKNGPHQKKKKNLKKKRVTWTGMEGGCVCVCVCVCVCKTDSTRFENVRKRNKACAYDDISTHISHPL